MWCVQRCYVLINNGLCIRHKGPIGPPHRSLWKRPSCRCVSSPAVGWLGSICFWKCRLMWRLCKDSGLLYFLLFSWSVEKEKKECLRFLKIVKAVFSNTEIRMWFPWMNKEENTSIKKKKWIIAEILTYFESTQVPCRSESVRREIAVRQRS